MIVLFEGLTGFLFVLMYCVAGIANGAHNMAFFYDQEVQDRAVESGLITKEAIARNKKRFVYAGILPYFIYAIVCVYVINKAKGFIEPFVQLTAILLIEGIMDRCFIDWYWVNHSKAWIIAGTEDLRPYIKRKNWISKLLGTFIGFPLIAAIICGIISLLWK